MQTVSPNTIALTHPVRAANANAQQSEQQQVIPAQQHSGKHCVFLLHCSRLFTSNAIEVELLSEHTIDITDAEDDVDDDCSWSE